MQIIICLDITSYRSIQLFSNSKNIIQSGRSPQTDIFYVMVNNSSNWHCYTLLTSIFTKESLISLTVVSTYCSCWFDDIKYCRAWIFLYIICLPYKQWKISIVENHLWKPKHHIILHFVLFNNLFQYWQVKYIEDYNMSFLTSPRSRTARSIARYDWPFHITSEEL